MINHRRAREISRAAIMIVIGCLLLAGPALGASVAFKGEIFDPGHLKPREPMARGQNSATIEAAGM